MPNYAVQRRRGTTAEHSSFTGLAGELTVDTTLDTVIVHDGSTAGGMPLLRSDGSNGAACALANGASATTQSAGNSSTLLATTAFVTTAVTGEDTLAEMGDVNLTTPADASLLLYDTGTSTWRDAAMSGHATISDTGAVTVAGGAATTAAAWATARTLSFTGDVTGSGSVDGSGNVATALTITADSVALGTDTTGNYVASLSAGTGVTVGGAAEGGTPSIAIGQAVATDSNVTFANIIASGNLTVNGTTTTVDTTSLLIQDPLYVLSTGATGSASVDSGFVVERGDDSNVGFIWDESADQFAVILTNDTGTTAGDVTIASYANLQCLVLTGTATAAQYSDLAERYETDQMYTAGTVVCFGGKAEITQTTDIYDSKVCGVISANPAHLMNAQAGTNETHPAVALTGRVPCKVMGTIRKGDLMVTSAQPGVAMSADERVPGTIIGKAIQDYTDSGIGVIEILVTLM
jgi:hypothetical protein